MLLESWIFSCLRVPEEGLAAELFLQLTDDGADSVAVLTDRRGIGKERWIRGVVGPVRVSRVAEPLQQVLRWTMFEAVLNANADRICRRISSGEAPQLCSRRNPIVPSSSSPKRSISASVVVKPRLARAVPLRP